MNALEELLRAAGSLETIFRRSDWRFCFIGGIAVQRWGLPRFTQDIDLTLLTGFGDEEKLIDALLRDLNPRRLRSARIRQQILGPACRRGLRRHYHLGCVRPDHVLALAALANVGRDSRGRRDSFIFAFGVDALARVAFQGFFYRRLRGRGLPPRRRQTKI